MKDLNAIQSFLQRTVAALESARDSGDAASADMYTNFLERANKSAEIALQEKQQEKPDYVIPPSQFKRQEQPSAQSPQSMDQLLKQIQQPTIGPGGGKYMPGMTTPDTKPSQPGLANKILDLPFIKQNVDFGKATVTGLGGPERVLGAAREGIVEGSGILGPTLDQLMPNAPPIPQDQQKVGKATTPAPALDPAGNLADLPPNYQDDEFFSMLRDQRGVNEMQDVIPEVPPVEEPAPDRDAIVQGEIKRKYGDEPPGLFSLENLVWLLLFGAQGAQRKMTGDRNKYRDTKSREYELYDQRLRDDTARKEQAQYKKDYLDIQRLMAGKRPDRMAEIDQRHKNAMELADVRGAYTSQNTRMAAAAQMLRDQGYDDKKVMAILNLLGASGGDK